MPSTTAPEGCWNREIRKTSSIIEKYAVTNDMEYTMRELNKVRSKSVRLLPLLSAIIPQKGTTMALVEIKTAFKAPI